VAENLTFGSLFAGIGGFDLGLERAGMTCKWQVEIDDYATNILEKHWPEVPRYRDIRDITELPSADLICGGFPCTDISYAGKGAGITGSQSSLWFEMLRIIRLVRPRYVLVENVPALLGRGMGVVLGDLSESGYDAEWDCIPAAALGAPHRRDRVFIIGEQVAHTFEPGLEGHTGDVQDRNKPRRIYTQPDGPVGTGRLFNSYGSGRRDAEERNAGRGVEGERERNHKTIGRPGWWDAEPDVGRVADGVPRRVDRLKGLGNAVVPQVAEWIGRRILEGETRER
jgi:DNA (cytosine-5)-methyltransferase 1